MFAEYAIFLKKRKVLPNLSLLNHSSLWDDALVRFLFWVIPNNEGCSAQIGSNQTRQTLIDYRILKMKRNLNSEPAVFTAHIQLSVAKL